MRFFSHQRPEIPIVDHVKPDGTEWTLKEKLWLGLSSANYFKQFFRNPVNWFMIGIFAIGLPLIMQRYLYGLGAVTHSSNDYPWGLFLGFGLFAMVPLSASGFMLGTTVELFGRKDFHPIERLALLNGLLGYFFAVLFLEIDLVLVAWHVATYLSVQIAEVLPAFFEWIGWLKGKRIIRKMVLGLTIAGIILSTLHQGALGALFTYAPAKVHPLWLSVNFQWIHFFCSSIFAGLSMVIVSSTLIRNFAGWRCDDHFKDTLDDITIKLGKGCSLAMITYLVIKIVAVAHDQEWAYLLTGWGAYYLLELGVGVVLPMFMFAFGVRNQRAGLIRFAAWIAVLGIVWNRLNTALICYNWQLYQEIPHWKEVWITITIYALYFLTYRFIVYRLPIVYSWKGEK